MTEQIEVETQRGVGRWHMDRAVGRCRAQLLLGHGAGGGVTAADLEVLASGLPEHGFDVGRFEQPWRLAGRRVASPPAHLDDAWVDAVAPIRREDAALVVGGRSAGARVACRTADLLGVAAVLALAFPLHPPGRPERSRADEIPILPMLVVQGSRDPFGTPAEVRQHLRQGQDLLEIAGGDHSFRVGRAGPITAEEVTEVLLLGVRRWVSALVS
jgi:predicted alpha/beta-hydrolase family hydrolase